MNTSNFIQLEIATTELKYVIQYDCYLVYQLSATAIDVGYIKINDILFGAPTGNSYTDNVAGCFPLTKGDIIKYKTNVINSKRSFIYIFKI